MILPLKMNLSRAILPTCLMVALTEALVYVLGLSNLNTKQQSVSAPFDHNKSKENAYLNKNKVYKVLMKLQTFQIRVMQTNVHFTITGECRINGLLSCQDLTCLSNQ